LPLPPANGSTGSHTPQQPLSDIIRAGNGSSRTASPESDIAQFLANPSPNTDEPPTVITKAQSGLTPVPSAAPVSTPPPPVVVPVSAAPPSIAGRRLGHFELIEAVGSGGMAAGLKARDTELGRVVALKILPPEAARDPESVTRFKAEARAAAKLDHDNIARVYFCGEDQGLHFIAFEFVEGINLRQVIDRRGPLTASEAVRYMVQVAAGLNHAAERGVVHRDIKPSNILITPDGRAKIVGTTSFGKGTVNRLFQLKDCGQSNCGAIYMSIARWLTPKGEQIEGVGISPDVEVKMTAEQYIDQGDIQLFKAIDILRGNP
jgi:hypothetical protein